MHVKAHFCNPREMDAESYALAQAVALGKTQGIGEPVHFLFAGAGMAHLLVAAGFHLGIALFFARFLARTLQYSLARLFPKQEKKIRARRWQFLLELAFAILYAQRSGEATPTMRALAAFILLGLSSSFGLRWRVPILLLLCAGSALLLGKSGWLSIALTFLAILPLYYSALVPLPSQGKLRRTVLLLFFPWLFTMPLVAWKFHTLSIFSPLLNFLFDAWLASGTMIPGFAAVLCDFFHWRWPCLFFWTLSAKNAALVEYSLFQIVRRFPVTMVVPFEKWLYGFSVLLAAYMIFAKASPRRRYHFVFGAAILLQFANAPSQAEAILLNVGQGDAILLKRREQSPFLIDAGRKNPGPYPSAAAQELAALGINKLSGILITHPDADHAGGLASILLRSQLEENAALWLREEQLDFRSARKILETAEAYAVPVKFLRSENAGKLFPGLRCLLLPPVKQRETNDLSPLCKYSPADNKSILLTGDMDAQQERLYLREYPGFLAANILKLAHHGSKSSSGEDFLKAVAPEMAWISVGARNPYHHPSPQVLERLNRLRIPWQETDQQGRLTFP